VIQRKEKMKHPRRKKKRVRNEKAKNRAVENTGTPSLIRSPYFIVHLAENSSPNAESLDPRAVRRGKREYGVQRGEEIEIQIKPVNVSRVWAEWPLGIPSLGRDTYSRAKGEKVRVEWARLRWLYSSA
jgi:hypothetical protein